MLSARTAYWPSSQSCPQAQADCTLALSGKTAPVACRSRSARRGCARGLLRPEACSHRLPVAARTTVARPGGHVHGRRRRTFRESDVPAWPRSGGRRSRQGAGGQRHGERDQSRLAPLEQHVGRGCKSGESVELRKSAEDISREVDPFRAETRVATKTARVCGGGRTACFV